MNSDTLIVVPLVMFGLGAALVYAAAIPERQADARRASSASMTETTSPRPLTAIGLLVVGAGVTVFLTDPPGSETFGSVELVAIGAVVVQLAIAAAMWLRLPGGWAFAVVAFVAHWLVLAFVGLLLLVFTALPFTGGGPLPGNAFNPTKLVAIVAFGVGAGLVYGVAIRDLLAQR